MTPRLAIVVGHHPRSPGVVRRDGQTENGWNDRLSVSVWEHAVSRGIDARVFLRPSAAYTSGLASLVADLNRWRPALILSLHSNAGPDGATGSEALHWPSSARGKAAAERIAAAYAETIGIRNRGAVPQSNSWNGPEKRDEAGNLIPGGPPLYILRDTVAPAVIGESHFFTNDADHRLATTARDSGRLGAALARAAFMAIREF